MQTTVDEIREKYPNPVAVCGSGVLKNSERYCVGGAVVMFAEISRTCSFPGGTSITEALIKLNRKLYWVIANEYALRIMHMNDLRNFEKAWEIVQEALNYGSAEGARR